MVRAWIVAGGVLAGLAGSAAWADEPVGSRTVAMAEAAPVPGGIAGGAAPAAVEPVRAAAPEAEDPCTSAVVSQPARPMWTAGAQTTQCGVMENDLGWRRMALGGGVYQRGFTSAERYGITRWLDLTWSLPLRAVEGGEGTEAEGGITDSSVSLMFAFLAQGPRRPAMAVSYGIEIPTANPAKGFGSGYADHQVALLASRDVGRLHFDFNLDGLLAGGPEGTDGAVQSGLVMTVPVRKNVGWLLETDGGSQAGTADRVGQALTGLSWAVRPNLVVDAAYTRGYTAGTPREQLTMGVTYAHRLHAPAGWGRWLGR